MAAIVTSQQLPYTVLGSQPARMVAHHGSWPSFGPGKHDACKTNTSPGPVTHSENWWCHAWLEKIPRCLHALFHDLRMAPLVVQASAVVAWNPPAQAKAHWNKEFDAKSWKVHHCSWHKSSYMVFRFVWFSSWRIFQTILLRYSICAGAAIGKWSSCGEIWSNMANTRI